MQNSMPFFDFLSLLHRSPQAISVVRGSEMHPEIQGLVRFYQTAGGAVVLTEMAGLPTSADPCKKPIFAFHIHSGDSCTGNADDPLANVGGHYDPHTCPHPYHAGDMPPLFGANGRALSAFLTDRFTVKEIIGKTVILHSHPDDFMTQPSGNAGEKIACGEIITAH